MKFVISFRFRSLSTKRRQRRQEVSVHFEHTKSNSKIAFNVVILRSHCLTFRCLICNDLGEALQERNRKIRVSRPERNF